MIGKTISHYKIIEKLGEGGMGVVYKAEDSKLKRQVALKFLPPELTRDTEAKERFVHEARAASALQHTNICTIHAIDETEDGQLFICMDYYKGETLKKKIDQRPLKLDDAIKIAIQIAQGLAKAHEAGIVHRDIKPANIIITEDGEVKIMDFGLVKFEEITTMTKTGTTLGTVNYMSPEQATGEKVDHRSDIWSLGVLLYEILTGQLPFKGDYKPAVIYSILNQTQEPITALRTGVSKSLENLVNKCLEKNASDRYQHADELSVDLRKSMKEMPLTEVHTEKEETTKEIKAKR
jgi:serine/threonine protein kinase